MLFVKMDNCKLAGHANARTAAGMSRPEAEN